MLHVETSLIFYIPALTSSFQLLSCYYCRRFSKSSLFTTCDAKAVKRKHRDPALSSPEALSSFPTTPSGTVFQLSSKNANVATNDRGSRMPGSRRNQDLCDRQGVRDFPSFAHETALKNNDQRSRRQSASPAQTQLPTARTAVRLLSDQLMPSYNYLDGLPRWEREKLTRIIAETEFLYSISTEVPRRINDHHWALLLETTRVKEREYLIRSLYYSELMEEKARQYNLEYNARAQKEHARQLDLFNAGHIVYGYKHFHSLLGEGFCGSELRTKMDALYGMHFYNSARLQNPLPKLIVDCRFLAKAGPGQIFSATKRIQMLHDQNWASGRPFEIALANFFTNETVNRGIKKHWHFLFGPHCRRRPTKLSSSGVPCISNIKNNQQQEHHQISEQQLAIALQRSVDDTEDLCYDNNAAVAVLRDYYRTLIGPVQDGSDGRPNSESDPTLEDPEDFDGASRGCWHQNDMDFGANNGGPPFVPHPYRPSISTWGIDHICCQGDGITGQDPIRKEQIAYLTPNATQYLDDVGLTKYRIFVVPAVRDSETSRPWHRSMTAALQDGIPAYRLPLEKHIRWTTCFSADLNIVQVGALLRRVYYDCLWSPAAGSVLAPAIAADQSQVVAAAAHSVWSDAVSDCLSLAFSSPGRVSKSQSFTFDSASKSLTRRTDSDSSSWSGDAPSDANLCILSGTRTTHEHSNLDNGISTNDKSRDSNPYAVSLRRERVWRLRELKRVSEELFGPSNRPYFTSARLPPRDSTDKSPSPPGRKHRYSREERRAMRLNVVSPNERETSVENASDLTKN